MTTSQIALTEANLPLPTDFTNYFPWACAQFQLGVEILISKMMQSGYVGSNVLSSSRAKKLKAKNPLQAHISRMEIVSEGVLPNSSEDSFFADHPVIKMTAVCNLSDKLTHVRIEKSNFRIPQKMIAILALVVRFYPYLVTFTIRNNVDCSIIYELEKVVAISNIVEVYLDGCYVKEANYAVLLNEGCNLKILSLARCTLTDTVVKSIMERLHHENAASKYLLLLNLSSNRITDVGAKYIAQALRSNRRLSYLNLAGNEITDDGMFAILDMMLEFPISQEELVAARSRRFKYLSERVEMVSKLVLEITEEELEKLKRKTKKAQAKRASGMEFSSDEVSRIRARAETQADIDLGKFIDPFYPLFTKDDTVYCYGNNTLQCLNIAYNNISLLTIQKILEVLRFQKLMDRIPNGLVNIKIEGNPIPMLCPELHQINQILENRPVDNLSASTKKITSRSIGSMKINYLKHDTSKGDA